MDIKIKTMCICRQRLIQLLHDLLKPPQQALWRPEQVQHEVQEPPLCTLPQLPGHTHSNYYSSWVSSVHFLANFYSLPKGKKKNHRITVQHSCLHMCPVVLFHSFWCIFLNGPVLLVMLSKQLQSCFVSFSVHSWWSGMNLVIPRPFPLPVWTQH